mmetsp:Transcript_17659/g.27330  ORF Transcript_17659/g.27330 Transcript_17659/m.27330 type:complete len:96 (-) Transcript_17659:2384-2671(-)
MTTAVKCLFFTYDLGGTKTFFSHVGWEMTCLYIVCFGMIFLFFHFYCFDHSERGHTLFGVLYINLLYFGTRAAPAGLELYFEYADFFAFFRIFLL